MRVKIIGTRPAPEGFRTAAAMRQHAPAQLVKRLEIPYWQERGWIRNGNAYQGNYQTRYGSFGGLIEDRGWGDLRFYILEPPSALRSSSHWACFQPRGEKGFHVHMGTRPKDISSGILTVERLITEAFEWKA
jgi:hypothetical protein